VKAKTKQLVLLIGFVSLVSLIWSNSSLYNVVRASSDHPSQLSGGSGGGSGGGGSSGSGSSNNNGGGGGGSSSNNNNNHPQQLTQPNQQNNNNNNNGHHNGSSSKRCESGRHFDPSLDKCVKDEGIATTTPPPQPLAPSTQPNTLSSLPSCDPADPSCIPPSAQTTPQQSSSAPPPTTNTCDPTTTPPCPSALRSSPSNNGVVGPEGTGTTPAPGLVPTPANPTTVTNADGSTTTTNLDGTTTTKTTDGTSIVTSHDGTSVIYLSDGTSSSTSSGTRTKNPDGTYTVIYNNLGVLSRRVEYPNGLLKYRDEYVPCSEHGGAFSCTAAANRLTGSDRVAEPLGGSVADTCQFNGPPGGVGIIACHTTYNPANNPCPVSFNPSQIKPNGKITFAVCVKEPPKKECNPTGSDATPIAEMHMSPSATAMLEGFEGNAGKLPADRRLTGDTYGLYDDGKIPGTGNCTVGIGHLIHTGPCTAADIAGYHTTFPSGGMSREQVESQFDADITQKETEVNAALGPDEKLTPNQYDALISAAFNTGANGLLNRKLSNGHTVGDDIRSGNCDSATIADDFSHLPGDTRRHQSEAAIFNFGVYNVPQQPAIVYTLRTKKN
jgi:GH24 family phage-related lysozyme (muramidase)